MIRFFGTNATTVFLAIATIGMLVGSIRIKKIGLSVAGVLCVALLCGAFFQSDIENFVELNAFCTQTGISLFVPCVALEAGQWIFSVKKAKAAKAFLAGGLIVSFGGIFVFLFLLFSKVDSGVLAGLFAGSLTSTPALAAATELFGNAPTVGYGISYFFGLLLIVLFVQIMKRKKWDEPRLDAFEQNDSTRSSLLIFAVGLSGNLLNHFCRISVTTGILLFGILIGITLSKFRVTFSGVSQVRNLGLILFFFGTGLSAGSKFKGAIRWESVIIGIGASVCAVGVGYLALRFLFRFTHTDALIVLCGGMTSTPAVSVLKPGTDRVPLYTISYAGALFTLLAWVRLLYFATERGW